MPDCVPKAWRHLLALQRLSGALKVREARSLGDLLAATRKLEGARVHSLRAIESRERVGPAWQTHTDTQWGGSGVWHKCKLLALLTTSQRKGLLVVETQQ